MFSNIFLLLLWLLFCWSQATTNFMYNLLADGKLQFEQHCRRACSVLPSWSWMAVSRALLRVGSNRKKDHSFSFFLFFFICSEFCHTLKWKGLGFTCLPHPDPPPPPSPPAPSRSVQILLTPQGGTAKTSQPQFLGKGNRGKEKPPYLEKRG